MRAISVSIYENKEIGNCSNHGISERFKNILIACDDGFIDVNGDEENLCKVVKRVIFGQEYVHVEPVAQPKGIGWMAGGSVVYSSDSRFNKISQYPLALHDRCESKEMYEALSR